MAVSTIPPNGHPAPTPTKLNVVWATDFRGRRPALEWLRSLDETQQKRMRHAITYVEQVGAFATHERLISLQPRIGTPGRNLWVIRADRFLRVVGTFRPGGVFLALWGLDKRRDDYERGDLESARRVMIEYDIAAKGSLEYVKKQTPTPPPRTFRPSIVVPDTARLDPTPPAEPVKLFRPIPNEFVWAWVDRRDLLPPHAPLLKSLCRLPTYHHVITGEEIPAYVAERVRALGMAERLALGLLEENQTTLLTLGALWAVELMTARTIAMEPETEATPPDPPASPADAPPRPPDHVVPSLFWVFSDPQPGHGRKRFLVEVLGPAHTRHSGKTGIRILKVKTRTYIASRKCWSGVTTKPAEMFVNVAGHSDPMVIEAIERRPK
jgi:Phage derived protein Gp49-like (DUF891)